MANPLILLALQVFLEQFLLVQNNNNAKSKTWVLVA